MGQLDLAEGAITIAGAPPYELPSNLSKEFIDALLGSQPGEETFIGELAKHFSDQDKLHLRRSSESIGGDTYQAFCMAAGKWAAIVNQDNKWHMEDFDPIYEAEINSSWAYNVVLTSANIRFVRTPRGLFTFPEFLYVFGMDIVAHIEDRQRQVQSDLEEVKKHITSDMLRKRLIVTDPRGNVVTREFSVLESLSPQEWRLPPGFVFLDIEED